MAKHLTDKQKKQIIADYVECGSYNAVAKKYKVAPSTVKRLCDKDPETQQNAIHKKKQNTIDMLDFLEGKKQIAFDVISKCLDVLNNEEKLYSASPAQISTTMGTVIDKFIDVNPKDKTNLDSIYRFDPLIIADPFHSIRRDVLTGKHSEYVLAGGRGSAKSSYISNQIIELLKNNTGMHALVLRQVSNTLKDSVYSQIKWAINEQGLESEFEYRKSPLEIIHKATKQKIYFRGADDPMKIKSIKPDFGYIGIMWFEELDQFHGSEAVRNIQQSASRGGDKIFRFKSFNPPKTNANWANKEILVPNDNRVVHFSTYLDVPSEWLGKTFLDDADHLKEVNPQAYEHEYMGVANGTGGMVFDNLKLEPIPNEIISTFDRPLYGIDWGYYPDPWAFNGMQFDAARRTLIIFDEATAKKKSNLDTSEIVKDHMAITGPGITTADSAEPKSIGDYNMYGIICNGAKKGPGSVDYSHKWLQSLNCIWIDPQRCPDTAREFLEYEYERDKNGDIISGYPDVNNHHIDAVRYGTEPLWKRKGV